MTAEKQFDWPALRTWKARSPRDTFHRRLDDGRENAARKI